MIDKLESRLMDFPGASNRARCFTHILNLVVKSIMHQFDASSTKKRSDITDERTEEFLRLAGDIDAEELELDEDEQEDYCEPEVEESDNDDGWINEREEMEEDDVEELEDKIQPVRLLLTKVSESESK
jgi:hypothetical protein